MNDLVKQMRDIRKASPLTDMQIEAKSGIAASTLRHWWTGKRNPKLYNFEAIMNTLGYDLVLVKRKPDLKVVKG